MKCSEKANLEREIKTVTVQNKVWKWEIVSNDQNVLKYSQLSSKNLLKIKKNTC